MFTSYVSLCSILLPLILMLPNEFFTMSEVHYTLGFMLILVLLLFQPSQMQIGLVTHRIGNPPLASWSFLVLVQFLGLPRNNPQYHVHPLKLSIAHLHPLLLNLPGFVLFSENLVCLFPTFLFFCVTTILQLPWLPTLCFILGRSTLK